MKQIRDLIDGVIDSRSADRDVADSQEEVALERSPQEISKQLIRLEKQMLEHARNLEFEKAATTRDQIAKIKELAFGALAKDSI